jgi:hypothetical protein
MRKISPFPDRFRGGLIAGNKKPAVRPVRCALMSAVLSRSKTAEAHPYQPAAE